jgi:CDP-diacylglycerol---serine O-phosphatidyltransferase
VFIFRHLPNFLTCLNLLSGCFAIIAAFHEQLVLSSYFIGISALFDFLDGFAARLLKVQSEIGKQLDSLADVISFGLAPGIIMFQLISIGQKVYFTPFFNRELLDILLPSIGLLIPLFSALRLAKFNIDPRQSDSFIGLPTPANAIFIASFALILENQLRITNIYYPPSSQTLAHLMFRNYWQDYETAAAFILFNPRTHIVLSLVFSLLLVSEIPLFSLKFKNVKLQENLVRYVFILLSLWLVYYYEYMGISFIIIAYIIISLIENLIKRVLLKKADNH